MSQALSRGQLTWFLPPGFCIVLVVVAGFLLLPRRRGGALPEAAELTRVAILTVDYCVVFEYRARGALRAVDGASFEVPDGARRRPRRRVGLRQDDLGPGDHRRDGLNARRAGGASPSRAGARRPRYPSAAAVARHCLRAAERHELARSGLHGSGVSSRRCSPSAAATQTRAAASAGARCCSAWSGLHRSAAPPITRISSPAACASAPRSRWRWRCPPASSSPTSRSPRSTSSSSARCWTSPLAFSFELALAMILVTHDISVVAYVCDRMVVMYAGKVVDGADRRGARAPPRHPYTMGLTNAFPDLVSGRCGPSSRSRGSPPDLLDPPKGCRFSPRCPVRACPLCSVFVGARPRGGRASHRVRPAIASHEAPALREARSGTATWQFS